MIDPQDGEFSLRRQCGLVGINRSSLYYQPAGESEENLRLMRLLDEQYTRTPYYGVLRMTAWLRSLGHEVNPKRVRRLLRTMGLEAVYQKPITSKPNPEHEVYPYLLRGLPIDHCDHVWSADITYVRLASGFVYLMAVLDWYSRYVLGWELSTTLEADFCIEAVEKILEQRQCELFNTDQGAQFTTTRFTHPLLNKGIKVSMDGRGRALDKEYVSYCTFIVHSNTTGWRGRQPRAPGALRRWRTPGPVFGDGADSDTSVAYSRRDLRRGIRVYPSSDGRPAGPGGASAGQWRGEYPIARRVHPG